MLTLTTALATALLAFSPMTASSAETSTSSVHVTVEAEPVILEGLWSSANIPEIRCPSAAPYLIQAAYQRTNFTGHYPVGVEIRVKGGEGVDVNIHSVGTSMVSSVGKGAGGWSSSVTNWLPGKRSVQVVLHCTDR